MSKTAETDFSYLKHRVEKDFGPTESGSTLLSFQVEQLERLSNGECALKVFKWTQKGEQP